MLPYNMKEKKPKEEIVEKEKLAAFLFEPIGDSDFPEDDISVQPIFFQILPEQLLQWVSSDEELPIIRDIPLPDIYPILGDILGVDDYKYNLASYWFLDILARTIWITQEEFYFSPYFQKLTVSWFIYLLHVIKENNWSREQFYRHMNSAVLTSGKELPQFGIPLPQDIGDYPNEQQKDLSKTESNLSTSPSSDELYQIIGLLLNTFSNAFQYELIKKVFSEKPEVVELKIPYEIYVPKLNKVTEGGGKKKKKKPSVSSKKKGKNVSQLTESDIIVQTVKEKNMYILPLQEAVDKEYFINLYGIVPEPEKKDKKGKKKK